MCTAGTDFLMQLKDAQRWLLTTKHRLRGVDNSRLDIKGALIVDIHCSSGQTTEILYVCDKVKGIYLSQTALKRMNIIDKNFPSTTTKISVISTPENLDTSQDILTAEENPDHLAPCGCPLRSPCPPLPEKIPFPATPEYRQPLEKWIKQRYASSVFNTCPHQKLHAMRGDPLRISFISDHIPYAAHKPIPVPHHWKEEVKKKLDADVSLGIIEPVPQGTPTKWCARMIVVPKKDGTPRRTVDLQNLNKVTRRETHHTPSPFNIVSVIPPGQKKTVLDAWNGYHSVPLSPDARDATTFITEWGRYRYLRAPQGFHASSDGYTKRFDDITSGFPRVARCIDDSLLWDNDISTSFWHTLSYIQLCGEGGIVFNPDKFKFAEDTLEFAGFEVTPNGYKPPKRLLESIQNFPSPSNITGVRSWFGPVNQISFAFAQAPVMAPFRELLERSKPFYWDDSLEIVFQESKSEIVRSIKDGVATFEVNRPTCLATDWSKTGIGFTLSQKHCSCLEINNPLCGENHWKVAYAGSRFTKDAESRYAPIEGEALALLFGFESCRMFVLGCPNLIVAVDHKPLLPIFNDRDLDKIANPRILKIRERSLAYRFTVVSIPGKKNCCPDAVSRIPTPPPSQSKSPQTTDHDIEPAIVAATLSHTRTTDFHIKRIREQSTRNNQYTQLVKTILNGFPTDRNEVTPDLREFWTMRNDLYVVNGLIYAAGRPLIPRDLRLSLLEDLHIGHQGVNTMKINARRRFFWPGMNKQIHQIRDNCRRCNETAPSQPAEPMVKTHNPTHNPFQQVATDLFHMAGRTYIIYAERFSGWTEVSFTNHPNTATVCEILRKHFTTFGVPEELSSDGGPPYNSYEFRTFLHQWGVRHRNSSAYFPQSNGHAESAVKCMKRILTTNITPSGSLDTDTVAKALLLHRNSPPPDMGVSPAELLFGRNISDHMPKPVHLRLEWSELGDMRERTHIRRYNYATKDKDRHGINPLSVGNTVSIQNQRGNHPLRWDATGTIMECFPNRKYRILVDGSRRSTTRNRRFLRKITDNTRIISNDEAQPVQVLKNDLGISVLPTPATRTDEVPELIPQNEMTEDESSFDQQPATPQQPSVTISNDVPPATQRPPLTINEQSRRPVRERKLPSRFKDYIMG